MRRALIGILFLGMLCMGLAAMAEAATTTVFYKHAGTGGGTSWDDAKGASALSKDLSAASADTVFYVAAGDYKLSAASVDTFILNKGVKLYGGFNPANKGTVSGDRNIATHKTILNGNGHSRNSGVVVGVQTQHRQTLCSTALR